MEIKLKSLFFATCFGSLIIAQPGAVNSTHNSGVVFGGTVGLSRFCEVLIVKEGWLEPNIARTVLSSNQLGGKPGMAQIRASRNFGGSAFVVSAETPIGFDNAPPELGPDVEFSADYQADVTVFNFSSLTGAPGDPVLAAGSLPTYTTSRSIVLPRLAMRLDINVNFEARTINNTVFPPGNYGSHVTLRCE